ncbi:MAG: hypothetical protein KDC88_03565 [Ignavibacteriae bacterium]|nr:hypothetical protein [Ignavibacteriota bacterium]MCB9206800.1 hypothetical protein [Ignavibacteriales bacterium]MCB9210192.1 hypothetical protein [Ignavibacteriales bacterium]MCB9218423.1 hypothetical protein [Ignavibacteriales bacterium]MCB9259571.1 hypothetical protein [Ignavibacteriales bacterium]
MIKKIITTVLDPEVKDKLYKYSQENYIPAGKIVANSINEFNNSIKTNRDYKLKFNDFDRIKTETFNCSITEDLFKIVVELSTNLGISKRLLLREIITDFVTQKL